MTAGLEAVPAPVRRFVGLVVAGLVTYAIVVGAGSVLLPPPVAGGSAFRFASTVAAGATAYFLVYHGGYDSIRDRLG